ncbi:acylphosphatase [Methylonatrum kenyense]|uniref:acylphosphatase n=1 Tax=Methylonatrum kenyense TaxID=455253 RepID=UPI0020C17FF9|nr:acylphosphatase [Methylonatrum kenyense]MCK8516087.1 acylphosphatase [Methylonatrum kenyense]
MRVQCRRFLISGRVQGVWFRAGTREQAVSLGLDGVARNLDDGRVEVTAFGPAEALEQLHDWLQRGTSQARVEEVREVSAPSQPEKGFRIA